MPYVTNEQLQRFAKDFNQCTPNIGGGKTAVDTARLRKLVRAQRDAAVRFVEIYCHTAASQPSSIRTAYVVAMALHVELGLTSAMDIVLQRANELDLVSELERGAHIPHETPRHIEDTPERAAAIRWWSSHSREQTKCDGCMRDLRRGEGYAISGQNIRSDEMIIDLGDEILCENCFVRIKFSGR